MEKKKVGKITHFFPKISVAVIELEDELKQGDTIEIEGHGKSFEQKADSMQVNHQPVDSAKKGDAIGMKVSENVKEGDVVFLKTE